MKRAYKYGRNPGFSWKEYNKRYKEWIYELCERVNRRDPVAERTLEEELQKRSLAKWAVKHWLKVRKQRGF